MRNTVLFLSCLLAFLWISIAFADNGVERGSIEYSEENEIPADVRAFIEKIIFANCDLQGASKIHPNFFDRFHETTEFGNVVRHFKIDYEVTYKDSRDTHLIYVDVDAYDGDKRETKVVLQSLSSRICKKLP